jgi:hypothetical protein
MGTGIGIGIGIGILIGRCGLRVFFALFLFCFVFVEWIAAGASMIWLNRSDLIGMATQGSRG